MTFRSETTVTEGRQTDDSRMPDYGWLDWGRDYYAAVSFSNAPGGRRLMVGWMNNWQYAASTPSQGWRSAMSLVARGPAGDPRRTPCARSGGRGPVRGFRDGAVRRRPGASWRTACSGCPRRHPGMCCASMPSSSRLLQARWAWCCAPANRMACRSGRCWPTPPFPGSPCPGNSAWTGPAPGNVGFHAGFPSVERAPVSLDGSGRLRLTIFLDRCSVEVFAQDGLVTLTDQIFPAESSTAVGLLAEGGGATLVSLSVTG